MVVLTSASIDLINSSFHTNFDANTSSVGVVNVGGEIHCDLKHCLQVCTTCLSPSSSPTPLPTPGMESPTPSPASSPTHPVTGTPPTNKIRDGMVVLIVFASFIVLVGGVAGGAWCRRLNATHPSALILDGRENELLTSGFGGSSSTHHLVDDGSIRTPPDSHVSFAMLRSSRAAVVIIDRSMRIRLWSTGKENGDRYVLADRGSEPVVPSCVFG